MESIGSKLSKLVLKNMYFKKQMELSGDEFWKDVSKNRIRKTIALKPNIFRNLYLETVEREPYKMYRIFPEKDEAERLIIFIHGGSFISTIIPLHFNFLYDILSGTESQALVPLYPLLPEGNVEDIHERLIEVYESSLECGFKAQKIILMGDSAGGYLSLILSHLIKKKNLPMPGRIVLISPLLDFCTPPEEADILEEKDPFISGGCRTALFEKLSGGREVEDPLVSPRFGDFTGYPEIDIFTGDCDLLSLQSIQFCKDKGDEVKINLRIYDNMIHNFPIIPTPEGLKARAEIKDIVKLI